MSALKSVLFYVLLLLYTGAYGQQDVDFHLSGTFLAGKNILKVKRDFHDPYLWVLAANNQVYRIHSVTNAIDDYSAQFSTYNNIQFTDIAGVSQDTVFIATNSSNVLEYKKGAFKVIGAADGLTGTINSIGIDAAGAGNPAINSDHIALIATSNGLRNYNYQTEILSPALFNVDTRIYEATYRNEMYSDGTTGPNTPSAFTKIGVSELSKTSRYTEEIWLDGNEFGHNLKSAYYIWGDAHNLNAFTYFGNQFWATENGLFQNNAILSDKTDIYHRHYLNGVDITKITSIYGLFNFGSEMKENLLVGTSTGLYFSNSQYMHFQDGFTSLYNFYHYDDLGNKVINDICVNATSYTTPVCEDGVWIAAADGLYLIQPDYAPYIPAAKQVRAIQFEGQAYSFTELNVCANSVVNAIVLADMYGGNDIQWYKDGAQLPNETGKSLLIKQTGDYYAVLGDPCSAIKLTSNHLKVTFIPDPVFTFNYPDELNFCEGTPTTLQTDNNPLYKYRWYQNGILNGNTDYVLNITNSGKYRVEVSSCDGSWIPTKDVQVNFVSIPQPLITADKPGYCVGTQANLSVDVPLSPGYSINWLRDGSPLPDGQNKVSYSSNVPGKYTVIVNGTAVNCPKTAAPYTLTFDAVPTLAIEKIINTTLCDGQPVDLKVTHSAGSVSWSTGATTDQIQVKNSGTYSASVQTAGGCTVSSTTTINFLPNPVLNIPDAMLCENNSQQITLTAPAGFTKYEWNGQPGNQNFTTGALGNINLIVTDNNGCQASQTIKVSSSCAGIQIPNAITPNGDGINDTWLITGLQNDPTLTVKIYNRYGSQVFESRGYSKPWDGSYIGQKLPAGTYYYVINIKSNNQILSGPVTIIY